MRNAIILCLIVVFSVMLFSVKISFAKEKRLDVQFCWIKSAINIFPLISNKDKYKDKGIDMVLHGTREGSSYAIKMVAAGKMPIAIANAAQAYAAKNNFLANGKKLPIIVVAPFYRNTPCCIVYKGTKKKELSEIGSVAVGLGSTHYLQGKMLFRKNGINPDDVNWVPTSGGWTGLKMMIAGKAEAAICYVDGLMELEKRNFDYNYILFREAGLNIVDMSIIVNTNWLSQNNQILRDYIKTTLDIIYKAKEEPRKTMKAYIDFYPKRSGDLDLLVSTFKKMNQMISKGKMKKNNWKSTKEVLIETKRLKKPYMSLDKIYTNKYLD